MGYLVGGRDAEYANVFMADVASRLANRVQMTTDGHKVYLGSTKICGVKRQWQPLRGHRVGREYESEARIHRLHDHKATLPPMSTSTCTPHFLVLPDLLDIIRHTATDGDIIQAMAAARAFLEAQLRQQHKMAKDLEEEQTKHKSRGHGMSL